MSTLAARSAGVLRLPLAAFFTACCALLMSCTPAISDELHRYNSLQLSESAQLLGADNGESAAFEGYAFSCQREVDHLPAEPAAAREAFQEFVDEFRAHKEPSAADKARRLALLNEAMKAGGWRAPLFNAMWIMFLDPYSSETRGAFDLVSKMANEGNPAALQAFMRWNGGLYEDIPQRIALLKAGIERGNPRLLSTMGFDLGTRTRKLRPLGISMLECAARQGDAEAYAGLAQIAWLEGRWVDAYRTWQTGANLGCADCLDHMEDIVLTRTDYSPASGTHGQEPRVAALRSHYEDQPLYEISGLLELRIPAPRNLWIEWTDEQVASVIRQRIKNYGVP